jgi:succinyl-CoA synthetase beta subunit
MDLLEYQGKQLFSSYGVPVPEGRRAETAAEGRSAAEELGFPVVVKAQVQIGGRGKAGGIKVADDAEEAEAHADAILGIDIRGLTVREVWVERASSIAAEYYAAIVFDRSAKRPLVMLSSMGGMEVEDIAESHPDAIARLHVDPLVGFQPFHGRRLAFDSGIDADVIRPTGQLLAKLYDVFERSDAMLVEVNPLIVTEDRSVAALEVLLSDEKVRAVLFNIFGGITRCDEVARGILQALDQIEVGVPIVVRLDGTNDVEGRAILAEANRSELHPAKTMLEAAAKVVELAEK